MFGAASRGRLYLKREVTSRDDAFIAQNRGTFEHITQLTNVAGPTVGQQRVTRLIRQARRRATHRLAQLPQELLGEQGHIGDALSERRQRKVEHLQPVEQVFAELPLLDGLTQVAIAGRDHAHVRFLGARAPEALEFALLHEPQKLGLRREAHLTDFVEKEHAPGGQLDLPRLGLLRTRERPRS